ncbi:hypothetical protein M3Y94_00533700 [Aphelenchoides besseyi]|nr:hypothetical protein M3Y94_00533700 [Aphelenchoides besseyi]KAI6225834.1 hypothetical protein M3Y95_00738800 [Aphelenchoides besseyi]
MFRELVSRVVRKLRHQSGSYSFDALLSSTSTIPVTENRMNWSDGVTIETYCSSNVDSEKLAGDCSRTEDPLQQLIHLWTDSFKLHFAKTKEFALRDVECSADAYEVYVQLESTRCVLEKLMSFYADSSKEKTVESSLLFDSVFRSFYDFVFDSMRNLDRRYPGIQNYKRSYNSTDPNDSKYYRFDIGLSTPPTRRWSVSSSVVSEDGHFSVDSDFYSQTTNELQSNSEFVEYFV